MTDVLESVQDNRWKFPKEELIRGIEKKDELIPIFLEVLENTCEHAEQIDLEGDHYAPTLHLYALFFLAQFREKRAFPLICCILSDHYEVFYELIGDDVSERLPNILASVYDGNVELLKSIIENEELDVAIRLSVLDSLVILVGQKLISRDEIVAYFQYLLKQGLTREPSNLWDILVMCCNAIYPEEVLNDIKLVYDENLVDSMSISFEDIEEQLSKGKEAVLDELKEELSYQLIEDAVGELEEIFDNKEIIKKPTPAKKSKDTENKGIIRSYTEPYRVEQRIGRNDPCSCGSGKKYKKCCGKDI
jgi:hypothetical protein